jgi:hypothetical protein
MGVAVLAFTLASQAGRTPDRPMTHRYRACPSIATISDVRMPRLAPAPITFDTHPQPSRPVNAPENGASGSICTSEKRKTASYQLKNYSQKEKKKKMHCCSILEKVGHPMGTAADSSQITRPTTSKREGTETGVICQGHISTVLLNHSPIDHSFPHTFSVFTPKQPKISSIRKQTGLAYTLF